MLVSLYIQQYFGKEHIISILKFEKIGIKKLLKYYCNRP